jgi:hypothetical protein
MMQIDNMNKPKTTLKPTIRKPAEQTMPFDEFVKRIVRINPQEIKLPK